MLRDNSLDSLGPRVARMLLGSRRVNDPEGPAPEAPEHDSEAPPSGMSGSELRVARRIAISAASEKLIEPQVLWDLACHATLGGADSVRELFDGVLRPRDLTRLGGDELCSPNGRLQLADTLREPPAGRGATMLPPGPEDPPPRTAAEPRYHLGHELGVGGSGRVVRARDTVVPRVVALKTLKPGTEHDAGLRARFEAEARITAQLEHPNIVPVYDIGALPDGRPYYTMRVVKQQSLRDVLDAPRLFESWTLARLVSALVQICGALSYAHQRGVLHRDIKPDNVLLGDFGEVYLGDWGVAKLIGAQGIESALRPRLNASPAEGRAEAARRRRGGSGLIGTPGYIAPEQIKGEAANVDQRADLFALGVVLYEVLVRAHPFSGNTDDEVLLATLKRSPPPPSSLVVECPPMLEELCLALLDKAPAHRPSSAERVGDALVLYLERAQGASARGEGPQRLNGTRSWSTPRGRP